MPAPARFPCPKCNRTLLQSGEVKVNGQSHAVFQCDECTRKVDPFRTGDLIEVALTFCVTPDGKPFDPAEPDGVVRWDD